MHFLLNVFIAAVANLGEYLDSFLLSVLHYQPSSGEKEGKEGRKEGGEGGRKGRKEGREGGR